MKRLILTILTVLAICAAVSGCGCSNRTAQEEIYTPTEQTPSDESSLGWGNTQDSFDDVWDFADEIFIGRVEYQQYYVENGLPNTAVTVTIENPIKGGAAGETRVISYSGGELNGELYTSTSVVVPSNGGEYLFLIEPELDGDVYKYPCGGYQGTYKVSGSTDDSIIESFNENNYLESEILGEPISQLPY